MPSKGHTENEPSAERDVAAARVFEVARQRMRAFRGLSEADRDDAVQQTVANVLEALDGGEVTQLDAFTRRVAFHCAIDAARRRQRDAQRLQRASAESPDEDPLESMAGPPSDAAPSPESLVTEKARCLQVARSAGELWAVVETAPANYRLVLEQRYRLGLSLEQIARAELEHRVRTGLLTVEQASSAGELQRATASVHAWHSRALRWLQQRACAKWREVL